MGEKGSDGGGLTREFFTLMARHFAKYMEPTGCFKNNSLALQVIMGIVYITVCSNFFFSFRMVFFFLQTGPVDGNGTGSWRECSSNNVTVSL